MWTINRGLRTIAGTFILASLLLAIIHSKYWLLFTAFVGINLFQSGFTNWCGMMKILSASPQGTHCGRRPMQWVGGQLQKPGAKGQRPHPPLKNFCTASTVCTLSISGSEAMIVLP